MDSDGDSCAAYHGHEDWCGNYDTDTFDSLAICCACGGGTEGSAGVDCGNGGGGNGTSASCAAHEDCGIGGGGAEADYCDTNGYCYPQSMCCSYADAVDGTCPGDYRCVTSPLYLRFTFPDPFSVCFPFALALGTSILVL